MKDNFSLVGDDHAVQHNETAEHKARAASVIVGAGAYREWIHSSIVISQAMYLIILILPDLCCSYYSRS